MSKESRALKKELKRLMKMRNQAHKGERISALKIMLIVEGFTRGKMDQIEFMERGGWRACRAEDTGRVEPLFIEYMTCKAEREVLDAQMKDLEG